MLPLFSPMPLPSYNPQHFLYHGNEIELKQKKERVWKELKKTKKKTLYIGRMSHINFFQNNAFLLSMIYHFSYYGSSPMRQVYLANSAHETS